MYSEALERQVEALRWVDGPRYVGDMERAFRVMSQPLDAAAHSSITMLRQAASAALSTGETYFWGRELTPLLNDSEAPPLTTRLRVEDLPSPHGFIWLQAPIPDDAGNELVALSWARVADLVTLQAWIRPADLERRSAPRFASGLPFGAQFLFGGWRFDQTFGDNMRSVMAGNDWWRAEPFHVRLFLTAVLFLSSQIVRATEEAPLDRHARRRIEQSGWDGEPIVRVIRLRRIVSHPSQPGDAAAVDWSCRWVVRGHWREQPCGPKQSERRTIFIAPHVKGPEDKPVKPPRATVFAVVR
jgi:hypothetical protein